MKGESTPGVASAISAPDYFALLALPRHPWVDPKALQENYHAAAARTHPDKLQGQEEDFVELAQAVQCLKDPATRLRHLVSLVFPGSESLPHGMAEPEVFAGVAGALHQASQAIRQHQSARSLLGQAAAQGALQAACLAVEDELGKLRKQRAELDALCREAGPNWAERGAAFWLQLATRARFYGKWQSELEDRLFALRELLGR